MWCALFTVTHHGNAPDINFSPSITLAPQIPWNIVMAITIVIMHEIISNIHM